MRKIVIGSRESSLAVTQSKLLLAYMEDRHPEIEAKLLTMKTTGDKILDKRLDQIGGKGLFVKELDRALLDGRTQLSVHSLKDLPMEVPEGLPVLCFPKREDPRDVLVLPKGEKELSFDKPIGTSSKRRLLQLKELFPRASFNNVRGNLETRLRKLDAGEYSAIVLAAAGLKRLKMEDRISRYLEIDEIIPAAGQGILAVQGIEGEDYTFLEGFSDRDATRAALTERAFVRELNGGCTAPLAAHAVIKGEGIEIRGYFFNEENGKSAKLSLEGRAVEDSECEELGAALAKKIREKVS